MRAVLRHLPEPVKQPLRNAREIVRWHLQGRPAPPPGVVKRRFLKDLGKRTGTKIFVETGTFMGDTVHAMIPYFDAIHSIELSPELHKRAKERFSANSSVILHQGDSGTMLAEVLKRIDAPALFWLDGHYSEGITAKADLNTPIMQEINLIAAHKLAKDHVIVIDDAREFTGQHDYPTEEALRAHLHEKGFGYFTQYSDIFIATAKPL